MGSTLDVVNAARALAADPRVDSSRVALVGVGLGGLIAINAQVVAPDVVAAVVAENPSSIDVWQNIEYFFEPDDEFRALIVDPRGTPEENPELWADVSPATFVDRVDSPLLILQGTGDTGNDPAWSDTTVATFTAAGKSRRGHHVRRSRRRPRPVLGGSDRAHRVVPRRRASDLRGARRGRCRSVVEFGGVAHALLLRGEPGRPSMELSRFRTQPKAWVDPASDGRGVLLVLCGRLRPVGGRNFSRSLLHCDSDQRVNRPGGLTVLIGRENESAATLIASMLDLGSQASFVGEMTPARADNFLCPCIDINLQESGFIFSVPKARSGNGDPRMAIEPDVPVALSSVDYFASRDPALDVALAG